jgi:hypothetical protein
MIRRTDGGDFLLITQHDHALLSGEMAEQFGNGPFARPAPFESAVRGVRLHDCGWPLHDDAPTRNQDGLPLDVFETPREIGLKVWTASVERAAQADPYAGLLVSLHVLSLSVFATSQTGGFLHEQWDVEDGPGKFAVIKFQQKEIERQEGLRLRLGLRTEKHALHRQPVEAAQKKEDQLNFNFRMLQAMDLISLAACCTAPPAAQSQDVYPQPGAKPLRLNLERRGNDVAVDPWPFAPREIELMIPVVRIPAQAYGSDGALRDAIRGGSTEVLTSRVIPAG